MLNVLVTGAEGQLGKSLARVCDQIECFVLFTNRKEFDICDVDSIRPIIQSFKPDYIINCAAYTAVDKAEKEEVKAFEINRDGVINLIKESQDFESKIIHISTDYVFNGESSVPYIESDVIDPRSVYGFSKAAGENALLELAPNRSIIIRTSWLYSEFENNFFRTMLRLGQEKETINVVEDQKGIPTYSFDLAHAIVSLVQLDPKINASNNILHFSNSGPSNWYEFAKEIMKISGSSCEVHPIPSSSYPTPAKRPSYSVLNTGRIENLLDFKIRDWKEALKECMQTYKEIKK